MNGLDNKVAIVTGGASGIGRAAVHRLSAEGASVVVTDIADEAGGRVVAEIDDQGGSAVFVHHDVASEDDWTTVIEQTLAQFDRLDVLVNNAGVGDLAAIEETTKADYDRTIAITQTSVFLGMRAAGDALKASGNGAVVNISSIFGASGGFGTSPAYHAAKGAVRLMTKNVALRWATEGVRVNSVHPGFIDTPILADAKGTEFEDAMVGMTRWGAWVNPRRSPH